MSPQQRPQSITPQTVVTFTYVILDTEGNILEQSDLPISYIHGVDGKMYPKVESAMAGAGIGDEIEIELPPEEGFGDADPGLVFVENIENVPPDYQQIGVEAVFENDEGETITMKVTKIENDEITLDANHPFAGITAVFRITVVDLRAATPEEIGAGEAIDGQGPLTLQ
ncbi:MAG: peptidylprolyl isomerase [Gammaproteobacteria bacterium]|jgi:FKBP-type peptidyl-prolyl cis-trans isomerase SlyD